MVRDNCEYRSTTKTPPSRRRANWMPVIAIGALDDKQLAVQIVEAYQYEQSGGSSSKEKRSSKAKPTSDAASIASTSSFSSTVALIRDKMTPKSKSKSKSKSSSKSSTEQDLRQKLMRNQLRIGG